MITEQVKKTNRKLRALAIRATALRGCGLVLIETEHKWQVIAVIRAKRESHDHA